MSDDCEPPEWLVQWDLKHPHRVWPHSQRTDALGRTDHMKACYVWLHRNHPRGAYLEWTWDVIGWTFAFKDAKTAMQFTLACKDVVLVQPS